MTTKQFLASQKKKLEELIKKGVPLARATATVHAKQTQRIFARGIKSNNSKIGQYDSKDPLYINPDDSPKKFQPKGKTGKTKFLSGKPHKTKYFKSYKDFRSKIGRPTGFVNLVLSGDMQLDFANSLTRVSAIKWTSGFKRLINGEKMAGQEQRFGRIVRWTKAERKLFNKVALKETVKALS